MTQETIDLVHQTQPTDRTCVQTCIAMALGVPVSEVIDRWGGEALNQQTLTSILTECKVVWNQMVFGTFIFDGWYFISVPSRNHPGGAHQILVRWSSSKGCISVLDPAQGVRYKPDGSDLISWFDMTPFWVGGQLPRRP